MVCPLCGSDNVFIKIDLEGKRWILRCFEKKCKDGEWFSPPIFDGYHTVEKVEEPNHVS